jgi:hypothetical protein
MSSVPQYFKSGNCGEEASLGGYPPRDLDDVKFIYGPDPPPFRSKLRMQLFPITLTTRLIYSNHSAKVFFFPS